MDASLHSNRPRAGVKVAGASAEGLVRAAAKGERAAQQKIYEQYSATLFGIIRRYVSDTHHAEDILSEACYRIFSKLHQYNFEGSFEGWMRRIAVHAITDYFRKHTKHIEAQRQEPDEEISGSYDADAASALSYKELLGYVQELPDTQRAVFNLAVFEEYPHKEIATLLGITENNSRWHLNDARRRLKEKIARNESGDGRK